MLLLSNKALLNHITKTPNVFVSDARLSGDLADLVGGGGSRRLVVVLDGR